MKSYDIVFNTASEDSAERSWSYIPSHWLEDPHVVAMNGPQWIEERRITSPQGVAEAGWIGKNGPGIEPEQWPRSPHSGLPMQHIFTLRLPEEYRMRGAEYVAVSFFAGDGQWAGDEEAAVPDAHSDDPFLIQLAGYTPHPMFYERVDIIDAVFGVLYLTEEEYARRSEGPQDVRRAGEHAGVEESLNQWDNSATVHTIGLIEREDPNTGIAPHDNEENGYEDPYGTDETGSFCMKPWAERIYGRCHLGGTAFPVQAMPEGLTPYYIEFDEIGDLNFGGGCAQLDLKTDVFDWACG